MGATEPVHGSGWLDGPMRTIELPAGYDFWSSVRGIGPCTHTTGHHTVWWATRTPDGPGTLRLTLAARDRVEAEAWGDGAAWLHDQARRALGLEDDHAEFTPRDRRVADLQRRNPGLRLSRSDRVFETMVRTILGQKVQSAAAAGSFRALLARYGERAPGPVDLRLVPSPPSLAALDYAAFHPLNVERQRAQRVINVARRARWIESCASAAQLETLAGIGPWTASSVAAVAWGDPDAVPVGDYHLSNVVCWALAGEPRGDDARMLELLEPYRGQRGRVVRLITASGIWAPRRGPRLAINDIRAR